MSSVTAPNQGEFFLVLLIHDLFTKCCFSLSLSASH